MSKINYRLEYAKMGEQIAELDQRNKDLTVQLFECQDRLASKDRTISLNAEMIATTKERVREQDERISSLTNELEAKRVSELNATNSLLRAEGKMEALTETIEMLRRIVEKKVEG